MFFGGREDEDKRRQEYGKTLFLLFLFQKLPKFGHILKNSAYSILVHGSSLLVHIQFTLSEGTKAL
jgi:hypothetical protein